MFSTIKMSRTPNPRIAGGGGMFRSGPRPSISGIARMPGLSMSRLPMPMRRPTITTGRARGGVEICRPLPNGNVICIQSKKNPAPAARPVGG